MVWLHEYICTYYFLCAYYLLKQCSFGRVLYSVNVLHPFPLVNCIYHSLTVLTNLLHFGLEDPVDLNHVADMVHKQQTASINEFEISHDSGTNTWHVVGSGLQRFVQMTNWR